MLNDTYPHLFQEGQVIVDEVAFRKTGDADRLAHWLCRHIQCGRVTRKENIVMIEGGVPHAVMHHAYEQLRVTPNREKCR